MNFNRAVRWEWYALLPAAALAWWLYPRPAGTPDSAHPALVEAAAEAPLASPATPAPAVVDAYPTLDPIQMSKGLPPGGHWRGKPALADLNADGALDAIASVRRWDHRSPGEGIYVWLGDGEGNWQAANEGLRRDMGYGGAEVADIDGDGHVDIAFSGPDVSPHVFLGDGHGAWRSLPAIDLALSCADVALASADEDATVDLAIAGFWPQDGGFWYLAGDGTGGFTRAQELMPKRHYGAQIRFADIDGDSRPEILAATELGPRVWWRRNGVWEADDLGLAAPEVGGSDLAVLDRDLDRDGTAEIIVAGMVNADHPPLRVLHRSEGKWTSWTDGLPTEEAFFDAEFAELDGRQGAELVAAGKRGILLIRMRQPGSFEVIGRLSGTLGVIHLATGDVNGDGISEILTVGNDGVRVLGLDPAALIGSGS